MTHMNDMKYWGSMVRSLVEIGMGSSEMCMEYIAQYNHACAMHEKENGTMSNNNNDNMNISDKDTITLALMGVTWDQDSPSAPLDWIMFLSEEACAKRFMHVLMEGIHEDEQPNLDDVYMSLADELEPATGYEKVLLQDMADMATSTKVMCTVK